MRRRDSLRQILRPDGKPGGPCGNRKPLVWKGMPVKKCSAEAGTATTDKRTRALATARPVAGSDTLER